VLAFFSASESVRAENACANQKVAAHRAAAGAAARALAAPDQHAPPDQPPEKISSGVAIPSSPISKTTHVPYYIRLPREIVISHHS
jgi:hypothetical protein